MVDIKLKKQRFIFLLIAFFNAINGMVSEEMIYKEKLSEDTFKQIVTFIFKDKPNLFGQEAIQSQLINDFRNLHKKKSPDFIIYLNAYRSNNRAYFESVYMIAAERSHAYYIEAMEKEEKDIKKTKRSDWCCFTIFPVAMNIVLFPINFFLVGSKFLWG